MAGPYRFFFLVDMEEEGGGGEGEETGPTNEVGVGGLVRGGGRGGSPAVQAKALELSLIFYCWHFLTLMITPLSELARGGNKHFAS